jgi:hypothetical protein
LVYDAIPQGIALVVGVSRFRSTRRMCTML